MMVGGGKRLMAFIFLKRLSTILQLRGVYLLQQCRENSTAIYLSISEKDLMSPPPRPPIGAKMWKFSKIPKKIREFIVFLGL